MVLDLRHALRTLRRSPGFTAIAVLILGLGIGANAALFGLLQATVLRPLPFPQSDRLVELSTASLRSGVTFATSWLDFQDWSSRSSAFTALAAYASAPGPLVGGPEPMSVQGTEATRGFFTILGVRPEIGRTFSASARAREAVISDRLWRSRFSGSPAILGRQISWSGIPATVIGVLRPGTALPNDGDVWIPADLDPDTSSRSAHNWPGVLARLRPGVSLASAQSQMSAIAAQLGLEYPASNRGEGIAIESLQANLLGASSFLLWLMLGAAGLVLLIACANLANLYLVRAATRQREAALRLALGASRWRLARQWIAEGILLALAGAIVGLWLASQAGVFLRTMVPAALPGSFSPVNWTLAAFALVVALLTAVLFAAAPALQALPRRLGEQLKQGSPASAGGQARTRRMLVVAEVALAMLVLAGAGLLLRTLRNFDSLELGFQPRHRTLAYIALPTDAQRQWVAIMDRLRQDPGLSLVAAATNVPLGPYAQNGSFAIEGRAAGPAPVAWYHVTGPGYFRAMGIPLLQGRDFSRQDGMNAPGVAVIDQATAQLYWPRQSPLGQRLRFYGFDNGKPQWLTVIGLVGNTQASTLRALPRPQVYTSVFQHTVAEYGMTVVAVGRGDAGASIRAAVRAVNPDLPVAISTMTAQVQAATAQPRLRATLLGAFALLAWILAALGLYGVIAQEVTRRRRELGIRLALGAARHRVLAMILRQSLVLAALGIAIGLLLAFALTRLLSNFLFQVGAADPLTLLAGGALLLLTALMAAWLPSRRASRISPLECLRAE